MEKLLQKVNKLQDIFCELGLSSHLNLPRIAVIGGQSVGKSSVLESFVGKDFLPRGVGIVTRRPLILHLNNTTIEEYGEFVHAKGKRYENFLDIRDEITKETDRTTPKGDISDIEIILNIYSPTAVNITLVDLPGMVRLSVGDQAEDFKDKVRKLNRKYIENKNTIILAVSAANSDLASSDALSLAKIFDPEGERTIGVLTKLDLMDKGTDARNILENQINPLKQGYIGVCNRSQKDIDIKKDIDEAKKFEENYLKNHPSYKAISNRLGTNYLQKYLCEILNNALIKALPDIRRNIEDSRSFVDEEMSTFPPRFENTESKLKELQNLVKDLEEKFAQSLGGVKGVSVDSLNFGAKIRKIMNEEYQSDVILIDEDKDFKRQINTAIQNVHGSKLGNFTPDLAIETIVQNEINKIRAPSKHCISDVMTEVKLIIEEIITVFKGYPVLRENVHEKITQCVKRINEKTLEKLEYFFEFESSYFNSLHKDFIRSKSSNTNKRGYLKVVSLGEGLKFLEQHLGSDKLVYFCVSEENVYVYKSRSMKNLLLTFPKYECKFELNGKNNGFFLENFRINNTGFQLQLTTNKIEFSCVVEMQKNGHYEESPALNEAHEWKIIFCKNENEVTSSQTEMAYHHIRSYMKIVRATFCDFMPKLVSQEIIKQFETFLKRELPLMFPNDEDGLDILLQQSPESQKRLEVLINKQIAYEKSMKILREINTTFL